MGEFNQASVTTLSENEFSLSLPWPVPGCEIVGSAKLRKRVHKNKREETGKRKGDYIFECLTRHPHYLRARNVHDHPPLKPLLTLTLTI